MDLHKALPDNLILGRQGPGLAEEALFCLPLSSSSSCFSRPSSGLFPLSVGQAQAWDKLCGFMAAATLVFF